MAEGKMVGWNELAELDDGTAVQVLGNICGGMGKTNKQRKEKNPWESDEASWAQEVPWSDDGSKSSSAEEQFVAMDKDKLMEQYKRDLVSGGVDVLAKMETKQAEELLMKFQENMTEISEEKRKVAV